MDALQEFQIRAKMARAVHISLDVWSKPAHDMIRIAAFAGFDVKDLMLRCFKKTIKRYSQKINVRTVTNIMDEMTEEFDRKERKKNE